MDTKVIEEALKTYKEKRATVKVTLERIEVYKNAINNPEEHNGIFLGTNREPGMPTGKGYKPTSIVEYEVLEWEEQVEILKEWIREEHSRIYPLQIELEQITGALNALTEQERFIIECKYFENMFWRDIEVHFNDKYRQQNYITFEGLKNINRKALNLMGKILQPFYNRFNVATPKTTCK